MVQNATQKATKHKIGGRTRTTWTPGNGGSGRPPGPTFRTSILETLAEHPEQREAIVQQLLEQAGKGNLKAIELLLDRTDGKAIQPTVEVPNTEINLRWPNSADDNGHASVVASEPTNGSRQ